MRLRIVKKLCLSCGGVIGVIWDAKGFGADLPGGWINTGCIRCKKEYYGVDKWTYQICG